MKNVNDDAAEAAGSPAARDLYEWLRSGEYLPDCLRDFHDQKDVFKAIAPILERRQQQDAGRVYLEGITWVGAQIFTIDMFLWFMARHGYTLQRSRARVNFDALADTVAARRKADMAALGAMLQQNRASGASPERSKGENT